MAKNSRKSNLKKDPAETTESEKSADAVVDTTLTFSQEIINTLNADRAMVLRIAWAVLGRTDATDAVVTSMDSKGMTLAIETNHWRTGKGLPENVVHEFTTELSTREEVDKEIKSITTHANVAIWPQGPVPFICVLIWLFCIAGSVSKYKSGSMYFNLLKYGASFVFPSYRYGQIALALLAGSHFLEALYVRHVLAPMKLPSMAVLTWMGMCFMLGFPATMAALFLKNFWLLHNGMQAESKKEK